MGRSHSLRVPVGSPAHGLPAPSAARREDGHVCVHGTAACGHKGAAVPSGRQGGQVRGATRPADPDRPKRLPSPKSCSGVPVSTCRRSYAGERGGTPGDTEAVWAPRRAAPRRHRRRAAVRSSPRSAPPCRQGGALVPSARVCGEGPARPMPSPRPSPRRAHTFIEEHGGHLSHFHSVCDFKEVWRPASFCGANGQEGEAVCSRGNTRGRR